MYFSYCPTKKIFGDNAVPALAREIGDAGRIALIASASAMSAPGLAEALAPLDARICLRQISHAAGEPDYLAVGALADTLRERQVTLLLCVGGASVIDLAKAAAVCAHFPGNAEEKWAQLLASPFDTPALPIAVISSLPGTSSESNSTFVVKDARRNKRAISKLHCFPRVMAFDPRFAATLPRRQLHLSMFDAYMHVLEQCIRPDPVCLVNDGLCITALSTILDLHRRLVSGEFADEDLLRFSRISSFIIDGATLGRGVTVDAVTHEIAVFLSAHFPMAHGETLARVLPEYLAHPANAGKRARFEQLMARSVTALNAFHGKSVIADFELHRHIAESGILGQPVAGGRAPIGETEIAAFLDERDAFWQQKGVAKEDVGEVLRRTIQRLDA